MVYTFMWPSSVALPARVREKFPEPGGQPDNPACNQSQAKKRDYPVILGILYSPLNITSLELQRLLQVSGTGRECVDVGSDPEAIFQARCACAEVILSRCNYTT